MAQQSNANVKSWWSSYGWPALVAVMVALASVIGWFANDISDFRSEKRELIYSKYEEVKSAYVEVDNRLDAFVRILVGDGSSETPSHLQLSRDELNEALIALDREIQDMQPLMRGARPIGDNYRDAIVELNYAADRFNGPADGGRELIEAISDFQIAQNRYSELVLSELGNYRPV